MPVEDDTNSEESLPVINEDGSPEELASLDDDPPPKVVASFPPHDDGPEAAVEINTQNVRIFGQRLDRASVSVKHVGLEFLGETAEQAKQIRYFPVDSDKGRRGNELIEIAVADLRLLKTALSFPDLGVAPSRITDLRSAASLVQKALHLLRFQLRRLGCPERGYILNAIVPAPHEEFDESTGEGALLDRVEAVSRKVREYQVAAPLFEELATSILASIPATEPVEGNKGPPTDLMPTSVVVDTFIVSDKTLERHRKNRQIKSYRRDGAPKNAPHKYSEAELDRSYRRKL